MKALWWPEPRVILPIAIVSVLVFGNASGATFFPEQGTAIDKNVKRILSKVEPGQEYMQIDDMRFRVSDLKRSGFLGPRWTDGKVFYEFDTGLDQIQRNQWFLAARLWSNVADLQFFPRTYEANYIHILNGGDNSSEVGMVGGEQTMSIVDWSSPYVIAHEIGHALGLGHEHARPDRNTFVLIDTDNIHLLPPTAYGSVQAADVTRRDDEHQDGKPAAAPPTDFDLRSLHSPISPFPTSRRLLESTPRPIRHHETPPFGRRFD